MYRCGQQAYGRAFGGNNIQLCSPGKLFSLLPPDQVFEQTLSKSHPKVDFIFRWMLQLVFVQRFPATFSYPKDDFDAVYPLGNFTGKPKRVAISRHWLSK